jgi:hypothetical protein
MLHKKLWPLCDMRMMIKWSICSTVTSQVVPEKELKLWCCLREITTALGASPTK